MSLLTLRHMFVITSVLARCFILHHRAAGNKVTFCGSNVTAGDSWGPRLHIKLPATAAVIVKQDRQRTCAVAFRHVHETTVAVGTQ